jgi:hypothetical protein
MPELMEDACMNFNHDMSCKKGSTSYAWHARAMFYTQWMKSLYLGNPYYL